MGKIEKYCIHEYIYMWSINVNETQHSQEGQKTHLRWKFKHSIKKSTTKGDERREGRKIIGKPLFYPLTPH